MEDLFKNLNPQQKAAATHGKGHALVLAGAGSGKTTTLAYRVLHLLNQGVPGKNICAVTFTNKAARELKERVNKVSNNPETKQESQAIWALTFHSLAFRILQYSGHEIGLPKNWSVADREDSLKILSAIVKKNELEIKPAALLSAISLQKNRGITLDDTKELYLADFHENIKPLWQEYQYALLQSGKLDFDDLLLQGLQLLKSSAGDTWRKKFRHVLVDEYQDTNPVQESFLELLVGNNTQIWAVGDELQVLYGFRLANVNRILEFSQKWKAAQYPLEYNYRSTAKIIEAANGVVELSQEKTDKKLKPTQEEGEAVSYFACLDPDIEAKLIAQTLLPRIRKDKSESVAILYRQHSQSRNIEHELNRLRIKYVVRGGLSFYNRAEIKHSRAILHLLNNPSDRIAAERILMWQPGFGAASYQKLSNWADAQNAPILETMLVADKVIKGKAAAAAKRIATAYLEVVKGEKNLAEAWKKISTATELMQWVISEKEKAEDRKSNLSEFENLLTENADGTRPWKETIVDFLQLCSLDQHEDTSEGIDVDREPVVLSTIHAAKGLEWDTVWVAGLEQDLFVREAGDEEEARRLVHVAMTRAKNHLFLSANSQRMMWGTLQKAGSIHFLQEIAGLLQKKKVMGNEPSTQRGRASSSLSQSQKSNIQDWLNKQKRDRSPEQNRVEFAIGQKVKHAKFGVGSVIKDTGNQVQVRFSVGTRTLVKEYANLQKL